MVLIMEEMCMAIMFGFKALIVGSIFIKKGY